VDETEGRYLRRIARLAGADDLTGLLAKHRFDSLLDETIRNARATGVPLSALMMDMDGLKQINDRHGHRMGANTIAKVGALIREILAGLGEAARFGGDEFCAYLPGMTLESAMRVGARIRREVEAAEFTLEEHSVKATISIGVATLDEGIRSGGDLLGRADEALYRAKAMGRNAVSD
jgi:diguanylate cyclase (GGDEF)-like protein